MSDQNIMSDKTSAELLGSKLGLFISAIPANDEAKAAMVKAALLMTPEELVEFVALLEVKYGEFKTQDADKDFQADLEIIKDKFSAKKSALKEKTLSAMADLENELDSL